MGTKAADARGRADGDSAVHHEESLLAVAARLIGPARALVGSGPSAEDLVYDTLAALYPRWDRIAGDRIAYARRSLVNRFLDQHRHTQIERAYRGRLVEGERGSPHASADIRLDIERALARLPPRTRCIVVLRYLLDQSAREVGRQLSLPVGSVRRITHDGLRALAAILTEEGEYGAR